MPQMMPLSWLTLYMFFILMLLMFSFMNYYSTISMPLTTGKILSTKNLSWKW